MQDQPRPGDVLITTESGTHFLSVIPHPHRLSFQQLDQAMTVACQWATANHANAWRTVNGQTFKITADTPAPPDRKADRDHGWRSR